VIDVAWVAVMGLYMSVGLASMYVKPGQFYCTLSICGYVDDCIHDLLSEKTTESL